jgi:hypothetical protein
MVVRLSASRAGRPLTPRKISGTHFCWRLSGPQNHNAAGRIRSVEKSMLIKHINFNSLRSYRNCNNETQIFILTTECDHYENRAQCASTPWHPVSIFMNGLFQCFLSSMHTIALIHTYLKYMYLSTYILKHKPIYTEKRATVGKGKLRSRRSWRMSRLFQRMLDAFISETSNFLPL